MTDTRKFKAPYKPQFLSPKQYVHRKTFAAMQLPQFPATLLAPFVVNDQGAKPSCTAFSAVDERYGVTGKQYDPDAQWQLELKFLGVADAPNGIQLDDKMQVGIKVGFAPLEGGDPTDRALAYFWVTKMGGYDWFDSFRLTIWQLYQRYGKVIPITVGVNWYKEWDNTPNGILGDNPQTLLGGHDIECAGLETFSVDGEDYLYLPGTWGNAFGDQGCFRVGRTVFNKYFVGYGAAYWSDDPTTKIAKENLLVVLLKNLAVLYQRLIASKTGFPPKPSPVAPPAPTPPAKPTVTYLWDTPENARHSVRVICDEEGLTYDTQYNTASTKEVLCACVALESGFMNYRPDGTPMKHDNLGMNGRLLSTDWGIVQCNDYWHIGAGKDFPSVDYVLANPEIMVRWMCRQFKAGKADQWSSFKYQGYKKFLP